ncbi:MAG: UDP-glucose dehydrogenase family protein [Candidatus Bathyarchaeia archaeon]|jgi:UDPglucose 6-dehydrogenase/GDP-mannose 6-dehydrogenase
MQLSIVGTGYVGLVTGVCLAEKGHSVTCVDNDQSKIQKILQGIPPIFEVGLEPLLKKHLGLNLFATTDLTSAVLNSEVTFIAVGTPFNGSEIDLSFIKIVSQQIGEALKNKQTYHLVVVKSTVIPGTTDRVVTPILEAASGKIVGIDFGVSMNPEFLTEGQAVDDFMSPDRIVLGGNDQKAINTLERVYLGFEDTSKVRTNNSTAEMIKYASNSMLANAISFANEIGNLCSAIGGIDVVDVMKGVHLSRYLNPSSTTGEHVKAPISSFYEAGCGFGGSCLPKDVSALIAQGKKAGLQMSLLSSVIQINQQQPQQVIEIIKKNYPTLKQLNVAVLGLAFKPDTDDIRETPAVPIIKRLISEGAVVTAYDPVAVPATKRVFATTDVSFKESLNETIAGVDVIVIVTRWKEFEKLPLLLRTAPKQPLVVDGRRMLDKTSVARYAGVGL